jgi:sugar/nucleoside kinase (ribokinase family)
VGDAFLAGLVAGLLRGYDLRTAARLGNLAGALTVAAPSGEGQAAVPPFDELVALAARDEPSPREHTQARTLLAAAEPAAPA